MLQTFIVEWGRLMMDLRRPVPFQDALSQDFGLSSDPINVSFCRKPVERFPAILGPQAEFRLRPPFRDIRRRMKC